MRRESLLLVEPGRLEWVVEELPPLAPDEVLVRTMAGAVSIGTELPQYTGAERIIVARAYPRMTGYESVGVVLARGTAVRALAVGDRVVAFYGHRTLGIVPAGKAIKVPDGVSDALALLVILTCDVAKGVRALGPAPAEPVLVTGAGAIGLLAVWVLRACGVRTVDVVEPLAERRTLAPRLGARRAMAPEEAAAAETEAAAAQAEEGVPAASGAEAAMRAISVPGYATGFECSARNAAFALLQRRMRPGGRIVVLADGNIEPLALAPEFHAKELTVVASSDGWDYQEHARWYFERVRGGDAALAALFTATVTAAELPALFARMARGEQSPVKVLVSYAG